MQPDNVFGGCCLGPRTTIRTLNEGCLPSPVQRCLPLLLTTRNYPAQGHPAPTRAKHARSDTTFVNGSVQFDDGWSPGALSCPRPCYHGWHRLAPAGSRSSRSGSKVPFNSNIEHQSSCNDIRFCMTFEFGHASSLEAQLAESGTAPVRRSTPARSPFRATPTHVAAELQTCVSG